MLLKANLSGLSSGFSTRSKNAKKKVLTFLIHVLYYRSVNQNIMKSWAVSERA